MSLLGKLVNALSDFDEHADFAESYGTTHYRSDNDLSEVEQTQRVNAFAHAYTAAMLVTDVGVFFARTGGNSREIRSTAEFYDGGPDYRMDTFRDLYNNEVGYRIGEYALENNLSNEEVAQLVDMAITDGDLILSILATDPDPRLPNSVMYFDSRDGYTLSAPIGYDGWPSSFHYLYGGGVFWEPPSSEFLDITDRNKIDFGEFPFYDTNSNLFPDANPTNLLNLASHIGGAFAENVVNTLQESGDIQTSRAGYSYFDPTPDGDLSDAFWVDKYGRPTEGPLGRTVERDQLAWENWDKISEWLGLGSSSRSSSGKTPKDGGSKGSSGSKKDKDHSSTHDAFDKSKISDSEKTGTKTTKKPIILDLDGDGIQITELGQSHVFVDANNDGLENRMAWAAAGNGVLFYDPDDTGEITEARQFIFTEWDPTAKSDLEALQSVFDTNGDGVLSGAELADFKLMVTLDDGTMVAVGLDELDTVLGLQDITSIDLTGDATHIELPDGSNIDISTTPSDFTSLATQGILSAEFLVAYHDYFGIVPVPKNQRIIIDNQIANLL